MIWFGIIKNFFMIWFGIEESKERGKIKKMQKVWTTHLVGGI